MARAPHGKNEPPKIIIVKKIIADGHGGHHGGAWKVAYADFVTAMMAFFLLLWLLGATTEKQRKGIADYFAPTLLDTKSLGVGGGVMNGGGGAGAGRPPPSISHIQQVITPGQASNGGPLYGTGEKGSLRNPEAVAQEDREAFKRVRFQVAQTMERSKAMEKLAKQVRFVPTQQGLRIDLVDNADYSMFALGTTTLQPEASALIGAIADATKGVPNTIMIRGHTDSLPYGDPRAMNNWMLSSGRAEATRRRLFAGGIPEARFERIEGVADREPIITANPGDPRNRRVAITLLYRKGSFGR
ncbi:flagellar motor protein MotB [Sphingomonas carotinifaciens]|uniref:Chemotaxis protein MotB n=1 Tax=Sphingomonas carotinifaciens TaxID=1166323 RepID=A0A1G7GJT4_9SPHN|nr:MULTISPECIES: flagellar motor protein MotB [Sphingomonas]MBB4086553.1 chemotaxis protein MotB [Sphingomonas carotinifaciens]MWC42904.1 OmpA family protein [Sphingomonas carotinifaciens]SDE88269.1 chemotaxis protein MotB [Sphingomonas carotinifaciens]